MFRVRTLAAAILMGAISGTALAASAPPISVADNMPAPTPVDSDFAVARRRSSAPVFAVLPD